MTHIYEKVISCVGAKEFSDELANSSRSTLLISIIWQMWHIANYMAHKVL